MYKRIFSIIVTVLIVGNLSACGLTDFDRKVIDAVKSTGDSSMEDNFVTLVQGNLEELYLGVYDEKYIELVNTTEAECVENYEDGIESEAEYFAYYYDIEYLTDELKSEIKDMYRKIYSYSNFNVGAASKLDDRTYAVKIEIYPINIFELVEEQFDEKIQEFYDKYEGVDVDAMTEEEYMLYDYAWAKCILDMCYSVMPEISYDDVQTLAVQIIKGDDDIWRIADNDMAAIDNLIIAYP